MWANCLDRNIFIKSLYSEVPHLNNAQIKALAEEYLTITSTVVNTFSFK